MAIQPTFHASRPSPYSWFESITEISTLGSAIIDGLGVFGLAANGMCPTLVAETTPLQLESKPSAGNGPTQ
jgi:hypothetical protein